MTKAVTRRCAAVHFDGRLWHSARVTTLGELIASLRQLDADALAIGAAIGGVLGVLVGWAAARMRSGRRFANQRAPAAVVDLRRA